MMDSFFPFSRSWTLLISTLRSTAFVVGILLLAQSSAKAVTIAWGAPNDDFFDSDGNALTSSSTSGPYTAYLGYFDTITPTSGNLTSWIGDFVVFDSVSVNLNNPTTNPLGVDGFTSAADLNAAEQSSSPNATPSATFPAGTQAYVWMRNQDAVNSDMEWALYTDESWDFPTGDNDGHDPNGHERWFVSSNPDTDVFGVSEFGTRDTYADSNAPEERTQPLDGEGEAIRFGIQTGTIPEPSSAILALLGLGLLVRRRR